MSNEFIVKFSPLDKVECCFDIVAVFGNNVEQNFVLSTFYVQFVSTLSKKNEISFDIVDKTSKIVANNCNSVEATFDFVEKNCSTCRIRQCCFDIVVGVDEA